MQKKIKDVNEILNWTDERVYILMAITRQKENEDITANTREVHKHIVKEEEDLEASIEHLQKISEKDDLSYRLYISVNGRNVLEGVFKLKEKINRNIKSFIDGNKEVKKTFKKIDSDYLSILQKIECRDERRVLFDLDNTTDSDVHKFVETIDSDVLIVKETPNGHHVVTNPFNYTSEFEDIEVEKKKDAMIFIESL